jgi:hypothetical protein
VLDFLLDREGLWIEATRFEKLGGRQAWRTAISEARAQARNLRRDIINRQRRRRVGTRTWTLSEYCLVKQSVKPDPPLLRGHDTGYHQ